MLERQDWTVWLQTEMLTFLTLRLLLKEIPTLSRLSSKKVLFELMVSDILVHGSLALLL